MLREFGEMDKRMVLKQIHVFVKGESKGHSDAFENHILDVRYFALKLAQHYKADAFVVEAAAYLHDLYRFRPDPDDTHEIRGAAFAKGYLSKLGVDPIRTELISRCILHHRGSKPSERKTVEEKIIACADAMDHIVDSMDMFYRVSRGIPSDWAKKQGVKDAWTAKRWVLGKIRRGWKKLDLPYAREMVRKEYEAALVLFSE